MTGGKYGRVILSSKLMAKIPLNGEVATILAIFSAKRPLNGKVAEIILP